MLLYNVGSAVRYFQSHDTHFCNNQIAATAGECLTSLQDRFFSVVVSDNLV